MSCLTPINVKRKPGQEGDYAYHSVPCGKCPPCRLRRVQGWVFRLQQEERIHVRSLFITLTYEPDTVPITHNGFMTLQKDDYQRFMKRLRKYTGHKTIKYYACGEYGGRSWRPHYHAIIFDVTFEDVQKAWTAGHIHVGEVSGDSIAYTCKYICKPSRVPLHEQDDRVPEFSLMSKKMGLNYLTPAVIRWHHQNEASYIPLPGGQAMALPRYYRDKLFNEADRLRMARPVSAKYNMAFEAAVKAAGSIENYYRNAHFAVRQAFTSANKNNNDRRNVV